MAPIPLPEPETWTRLCAFLGVPPALGHRLWHGIARARWSEAVELRAVLVRHYSLRVPWAGRRLHINPTGEFEASVPPATLLKVLRNCRAEQVLSREDRRQIGAIILSWMSFDEGKAQAWNATHQPLWVYGPRPDCSRWLSKVEYERQQHS